MDKTNGNSSLYHFGDIDIDSPLKKRALFFSLWDGIFANIMIGLVETFYVAAALFLESSPLAISILGSLPLLLSSFGQLLIPNLVDSSAGRKKYVLQGTTLQSFFLFLLAFNGYLPQSIRVWTYVVLFTLYGFCGNVVAGFWIAWMGDLVPSPVRGRHFAWRNRIFSTIQLFCAIGAGVVSRRYTTETAHWLIFMLIFLTAGFSRMISSIFLSRQYEPPVIVNNRDKKILSIFNQTKPFLFYCIGAALVQGTTVIAGPFFNVWYIRDLHFNFFTLSVASAATILGSIIAVPFWGKIADALTNRTVILITVFLIAIIPLPYIASDKPWQIWLLNFYTGCCWSGYNLSNFNYLLAAAGKEKTEQNISFAVAVGGIFIFIFSIIGGYLSTRLPCIFRYQLHSLFLLSSILRFIVYFVFIIRYPRIETTKKIASGFYAENIAENIS